MLSRGEMVGSSSAIPRYVGIASSSDNGHYVNYMEPCARRGHQVQRTRQGTGQAAGPDRASIGPCILDGNRGHLRP